MVLKRDLECGFIGYDAPTIPRARRSARKRILCKKTFDEDQLCAFELLAVVAGKLLQGGEPSSASSSAAVGVDNHTIRKEFIKQEPQYNVDEAMRTEQEEQGSSEDSVVSSAICLQKSTQNESKKEAVDNSSKEMKRQMLSITNSACSGKVGFDSKPLIHRNEDGFNELPSKIDGGSLKCGESFGPNVDNGIGRGQEPKGGTADKFSSKVSAESCGKISPSIQSSQRDVLGQQRGSVPDYSHAKHWNDIKIEGIDGDVILSKFSNPISQKAYGSPTSADNCQMRNLLTSKYWKSAPKLKDSQPANSGSKRNNINHSGKFCYEQERSQHNTPFKKRKLFGQTSVVTNDGGISSESVSNITAKGVSNWSGSVIKHRAGNKIAGCHRSLSSSSVKLSVKSFKVPELLIQVPESASVGSLKKTVLDAITTVLGGGLRVGVLLHGKKVRDDSKTLLQTGISADDNLKDLNFILEPSSSTQLSLNSSNEDCPVLPTCPLANDYVNRSLKPKQEFSLLDKPDNSSATGSGRICQDLVPFSAPELENKPVSDSRALVPVPEDVPALAAVPINARPRRAEIGQRRTRRPFSVSEVEALVQAVENLGTGRWRDVKLCAFENAKHRTYVDLKDKWKTLVHTARISPQQRRGEPVPQQLLDRVLAAHAYWSQHHAKQMQHPGFLRISDSPADKVAA